MPRPYRIELFPDLQSLSRKAEKPAAARQDDARPAGGRGAEQERDALAAMLDLARAQAAVLQASPPDRVHLATLSRELTSVWKETEGATFAIIDAVDQISRAARLASERLSGADREAVTGIFESSAMKILEACAFNDLGGQRIARLNEAIGLLERHVQRLGEALGGPARLQPLIAEAETRLARQRGTEGSFGLAQGPALATGAGTVDQSEIDALFAKP